MARGQECEEDEAMAQMARLAHSGRVAALTGHHLSLPCIT